jgi:hypothetical protein
MIAELRGSVVGGGEHEDPMDNLELIARLAHLRMMHRDLDAAIDALIDSGTSDQLQLARFKKRKLALRDEIAVVEGQLIPDIIA